MTRDRKKLNSVPRLARVRFMVTRAFSPNRPTNQLPVKVDVGDLMVYKDIYVVFRFRLRKRRSEFQTFTSFLGNANSSSYSAWLNE